MFFAPFLLFVGGAVSNSAIAGTALAVGTAATVLGGAVKEKKSKRDRRLDFNHDLERAITVEIANEEMKQLPPELARKAKKMLEVELREIEKGNPDLVVKEIKKSEVPRELKHFASKYALTRRDEGWMTLLLSYESARTGTGSVGKMIRELSQASGIPYDDIKDGLFDKDAIEPMVAPMLKSLKQVSKDRLADSVVQKRITLAKELEQKS